MRINTLKYIFLGLALSVVIGLFIWRSEGTGIKIAAASIATTDEVTQKDVQGTNLTTTLEKPRYSGRDNQGRQWLITADKAQQLGSLNTGTIKLLQVTANYQEEDKPSSNTLAFSANEGTYTRANASNPETLVLKQNVIVKGHNLTLKTEELTTLVNTRSVSSNKPVHLSGPYGNMFITLTAGAFNVTEGGNRIQLTGGLKARLMQPKLN